MTRIGIGGVACWMLLATAAAAQDGNPVTFGIYYRCNQALEAQLSNAQRGVELRPGRDGPPR